LTSLGCRLNESEIEAMASQFNEAGWRIVAEPDEADVCVVNTCTVTSEAGRKSRQRVRRLHRLNPNASIVVTGCHATLFPQEMERLRGVSQLVPNPLKEGWVEDLVGGGASMAEIASQPGPALLGRTRAFVKVQDGCDNHCTFCITRLARGPGRSRPSDDVLVEVDRLVRAGYQEVVLTGVNLGSYGRDKGQTNGLFHLVQRLLTETTLPRLRLSSLEPWDLSPDFFDLWALGAGRLCRQLHLPLQSGCDATLRRMGRRITSVEFADLVDLARRRVPDLAVTTDMMVGFPGESPAEFEQSYRFAQDMAFARIHVFVYSPRPGTAAARLPEQVAAELKTTRGQRLRQLARRQADAFQSSFVGQVWPVLWHGPPRAGTWRGLTDNYLQVETTCAANLSNLILPTRLIRSGNGVLKGEITDLEATYAG
jgi:threonylcarbamoyladenosine tRNA methylthiotransferase MtaB